MQTVKNCIHKLFTKSSISVANVKQNTNGANVRHTLKYYKHYIALDSIAQSVSERHIMLRTLPDRELLAGNFNAGRKECV